MQRIRMSVYSIILMGVLLASLSTMAMATNNSGKIDINHATAAEFQLLKGVGKVVAERIVAYRDESGAFKTIDDIKNVKGIGDKTFEKIKDFISVDDGESKVMKK